MSWICLDCGMEVPPAVSRCPKCDALLAQQTDGSTLHIDIAHHGETVAQALSLFQEALAEARQTPARTLRAVVGGGLIREEMARCLAWLQHAGEIPAYSQEAGNAGAFLVALK